MAEQNRETGCCREKRREREILSVPPSSQALLPSAPSAGIPMSMQKRPTDGGEAQPSRAKAKARAAVDPLQHVDLELEEGEMDAANLAFLKQVTEAWEAVKQHR